MANLSNINDKFLVTTGGNVLIGQTGAVGSSILQVTGNSTFAGTINGSGIELSNYMQIKVDDAEIYWTNTANNDYWRWKRDASNNFICDHYNGSSTTAALTLNSSNNATFAGNVDINGGEVKISGNYAKLFFEDTGGTIDAYIVNNANGLFFGKTNSPAPANDILSLDLSAENVGIGTASPGSKLEIAAANANQLGMLRVTPGAATAYGLDIGLDPTTGDPVFSRIVSNVVSESFRIQRSTGNVGIGTSSPSVPLEVVGYTRISRTTLGTTYQQIEVGDVNTTFNGQDPDGWMSYYFNSNGTTRLYIDGNSGNSTFDGSVYLASASNEGKLFFGTADAQYNTFGGGTYGYMGYNTGGYHRFLTSGTERMRITSGGTISVINSINNSNILELTTGNGSETANDKYQDIAFEHNSFGAITNTASIRSTMRAGYKGELQFLVKDTTLTEAMRIESDGDVVLTEGNLTMSGATPFISLSNTAETECGIVMLDSADAGQSAKITYDAGSSNSLKFYNNAASERMRIDSGGTVTIPGVIESGGGIKLGGTATANKLNDYEEGTWTPNVTSTTVGTFTAPPSGSAQYTKIGEQVRVSFHIEGITANAGAQYFVINGLPFTQRAAVHQEQGFCDNYPIGNRRSGIIINNSSGNVTTWYVAWYNNTSQTDNQVRGTIIYTTTQ